MPSGAVFDAKMRWQLQKWPTGCVAQAEDNTCLNDIGSPKVCTKISSSQKGFMMQNIEISEQQKLSDELAEIAGMINKRVSQTAYEIGQNLIRAKELCRHGEWLLFLGQAGINERNAQRMMRFVRLAGDVKDIQALPSMNSILEQDREKHEQDLGMAIQTIFEGALLGTDIFKSQVDKGDKLAATKLGGLILRDIQPSYGRSGLKKRIFRPNPTV